MQDLFSPMDADSGMDFMSNRGGERKFNGQYMFDFNKVKNKESGYKATLRLLPNLRPDKTLGSNAIKREYFQVSLSQDFRYLNGKYDSQYYNSFKDDCPLTTQFFAYKKSNNFAEKEKANLFPLKTKFYCYALVVEDEQQPELVGKIVIFPFTKKIADKIEAERTGEITGVKCNVFDFVNGKDFRYIVKEVAKQINYDSCMFLGSSPLKINGKTVPTAPNANGVQVVRPEAQEKIINFLLRREYELENYAPKRWDDETREKVSRIMTVIAEGYDPAKQTSAAKPAAGVSSASDMGVDMDNLFGEDEAPAQVATKPAATATAASFDLSSSDNLFDDEEFDI